MKALAGFVFTIALLGALWGVLALVAVLAGVMPPLPGAEPAPVPAPEDEALAILDAAASPSAVDAAVPPPSPLPPPPLASAPVEPSPAEAPVAEAPRAIAPTAPEASRYRIEGHLAMEGLSALYQGAVSGGDIVPGDDLELAVGCADRTSIVSFDASLTPTRIAVIEHAPSDAANIAFPGRALVTGEDGTFILPVHHESPRGGSRGGGLFAIQARRGRFTARRMMAGPMLAAARADLDGRVGDELVVLDRREPWAERPAVAHVLSARGRVTSDVTLGIYAGSIALADLNGDGRPDLAATPDGALQFALGERGGFGDVQTSEQHGEWAIIATDLDGDGRAELVTSGQTTTLHRFADGALEHTVLPLPSQGGAIQVIAALDIDGDGRQDLLARYEELVVFAQTEPLRFDRSSLGTPRPLDACILDLDHDARLDLVYLVQEGEGCALVVVPHFDLRQRVPAAAAVEMMDAASLSRVVLR